MYKLGRIYVPDDSLHQNLISDLPSIRSLIPSKLPVEKVWSTGPILDQGETPECTEFSWHAHINAEPHAHPDLWTDFWPSDGSFYADEKKTDGIPTEDGSTTQAGAQILKDHGIIEQPVWGFDEWTARRYVLTTGPLILGCNWYNDMFSPDSQNIVHINNSDIEGGHQILIIGFSLTAFGKLPSNNPLYKFQNSWGTQWGETGYGYISQGDLARLIAENGQLCDVLNWKGY